jgi:hypothetical protein
MATGGSGNFIAALVADPAAPPDVKLLRGYIGASDTDKTTRLYSDPELSVWWDIPDSAIVHRAAVADDPLGAEFVWVLRDTVIARHAKNEPEVRAKFLSGDLQRQYMPGAGAQGETRSGPPSYYDPCSSQCKTVAGYCTRDAQPSYYDPCTSRCETAAPYCEGEGPPSYYDPCSSQCKTVAGYCPRGGPPSYYDQCSSQCKTVAGYCTRAGPPSYYDACTSQCKTVAGYCVGDAPTSYYGSCASQCKTVSGYC